MNKETLPTKEIAIAGIISVFSAILLWLSVFNIPLLPVIFGIGISLPVLYIIFTQNIRSGIFTAVFASLILCAVLPIVKALLVSLFFFAPSLFVGWLLTIKISSQDNKHKNSANVSLTTHSYTDYPLSPAIFQLALIVALATIIVLAISFSSVNTAQNFNDMVNQVASFMQQNKLYDSSITDKELQYSLREMLPILIAVSLALYGFLFQLAALYISMRIAKSKGLLGRSFGYWPSDLRMPPIAMLLFIGLWILSYILGSPKFADAPTLIICINVIISVLSMGFCLSGLAVLHQVTSKNWVWLRIVIYACLFSIVLTPIIFFGLVIMGLFATHFPKLNQSGRPPLS